MNKKNLLELIKDIPDDYELCISKYLVYTETSDGEPYFLCVDDPIAGVAQNDDTKEMRFFTERSEEEALKLIEKDSKVTLFEGECENEVDTTREPD